MGQDALHYLGTYDTEKEIMELKQHEKANERFIVFSMPLENKKAETNVQDVPHVLLNIGIHPNLLGYRYILYAMDLILEDDAYLRYITKRLYIDIAIKYHTTATRVERAMRHAISSGWSHGNVAYINELFGNSVDHEKGVPSNSQFLSALYFYIRKNRL